MLTKQNININFAQGLDTKTDPWQVSPDKFLSLENSVFTKQGLLKKRNGFAQLTTLPDSSSGYLTTFNGGLTALGTRLNSYSADSETWTNKGFLHPLDLNVSTLVRNNLNQQYADSAVSASGLVCTVYTENNNGTLSYKYIIADQATGQTVVSSKLITGTGTTTDAPRVFYLYPYFIIVFCDNVSGTNHLKAIPISVVNPATPGTLIDLSAQYSPGTTGTFDGVVNNNNLYLFFNGNSTTIKAVYLTNTLIQSSVVSYASQSCSTINATIDLSGSLVIIWASWIVPSTGQVKALAVDGLLNPILAPTQILATSSAINIASSATGGVLTVFLEIANTYFSGVPTDYIESVTLTQSGTAGSPVVVVRSVGLASKTFIYNGITYFFALFNSSYQPTYFLLNAGGHVVARFAYQNGPSAYYITGLPTVTIQGSSIFVPYLYKDLIAAVNKGTALASGTQSAGIYSQTGVNLLEIDFEIAPLNTSEIGNNLNISGGFVAAYDGVSPTEQNFFLYPEPILATWSATGGGVHAQPDGATNTNAYYAQATYEWTDNQGNAFRSAPSIPVAITTTGSGTSGTITYSVPTLRLTYKISSPVKIVIYRWSVGQEEYYQTTSITAPVLNDTTTDSVQYVDPNSDSTILGNNLIYTTGGVVEDVAPPATSNMTLFQSRLWLVDAEDRNLLWYSKQVIEATPVEMSDLFTIYVAPTTASQGSTGPITALSSMDDKLIIFKESAIYYINGQGPDNTGANNQFTDPIFITSTVGCANQSSIVFIPAGLMFQSDKGIWLLGRDLSTQYIGAPVEDFNEFLVLSSLNIPDQNQVRFTLSNGVTLMYDYYYNQWGTFYGIPGLSSTPYQGLHTFINSFGKVFQETPGSYLDGSNPVLLSFKTAWINLAGLQGYQRAYFFYLIGKYLTPHKLMLSIAYDYNISPEQSNLITPDNFAPNYGGPSSNGQQTVYGQNSPYGGPGNVEQWRVFLTKQRCQSFQISLQEIYDPTFGIPANEGLTLSGLNLVVAIKKGWRPISSANSVGRT